MTSHLFDCVQVDCSYLSSPDLPVLPLLKKEPENILLEKGKHGNT